MTWNWRSVGSVFEVWYQTRRVGNMTERLRWIFEKWSTRDLGGPQGCPIRERLALPWESSSQTAPIHMASRFFFSFCHDTHESSSCALAFCSGSLGLGRSYLSLSQFRSPMKRSTSTRYPLVSEVAIMATISRPHSTEKEGHARYASPSVFESWSFVYLLNVLVTASATCQTCCQGSYISY